MNFRKNTDVWKKTNHDSKIKNTRKWWKNRVDINTKKFKIYQISPNLNQKKEEIFFFKTSCIMVSLMWTDSGIRSISFFFFFILFPIFLLQSFWGAVKFCDFLNLLTLVGSYDAIFSIVVFWCIFIFTYVFLTVSPAVSFIVSILRSLWMDSCDIYHAAFSEPYYEKSVL